MQIQAGQCVIQLAEKPDTLELTLSGVINENFSPSDLLTLIDSIPGKKAIALDLKDIRRINSAGVRSWIRLMEAIQSKRKVVFRILGEAFIHQAAVIPNILGDRKGAVETFLVPLVCNACNAESIYIARPAEVDVKAKKINRPKKSCEQCKKGTLEEDIVPSNYLSFLTWFQSQ